MKYLIILSTFFLLISCSKSDENITNHVDCNFDFNSYEYQLNNQWPVEQLNEQIDIQFPSRFKGGITFTFEGNYFSKFDYSDSTYYDRLFGGATYNYSFGSVLKDSTATSNYYKFYRYPYNPFKDSVLLDKRIAFQQNGIRQGILYYTYTNKFYAKLFWINDNTYRELLDITSLNCSETEVINILSSIKYH
jgi:hypothetical protein